MSKIKPINRDDIVEVLENNIFPALAGAKGVVIDSFNFESALVTFPIEKLILVSDPEKSKEKEYLKGKNWLIPWKFLRVLGSKYGDKIGELEELVYQMEDDLALVRAVLTMSEEMREVQEDVIGRYVIEIDELRKELYHLRGC